VGLVVHGEHPAIVAAGGHFRPRTLVEDPREDGVFWVIDAGARRERAGRLYRLDTRTSPPAITLAAERLDRPHGSAIGPDGWLYVGEVQRIVRVDPHAPDVRASREVVIDGLPTQIPGRDRIRFHPLSSFVITAAGEIILNRGSSTDHCAESLVEPPASQPRCHDEAEHTAALWRYPRLPDVDGRARWGEPVPIAHGLRNSVALVAHTSGTILQGENGTDLPEPDRPREELNVITEGAHYGWPYCFERDAIDPRWARAGFACDPARGEHTPPHLLLPAHGAPLGMTYVTGDRLGSRQGSLRGALVIALHGYRSTGHRVLTLPVDGRGIPPTDAPVTELVGGWEASALGPRGAPVGVTMARDGALWIVEDNNGTVLRVSTDAHASARRGDATSRGPVAPADEGFVRLHREVLLPRCGHCHELLRADADHALEAITREGWLREEGGTTRLWERTRPGAAQRMPVDGTLDDAETDAIRRWADGPRCGPRARGLARITSRRRASRAARGSRARARVRSRRR
jgi:glucose/arabinose dehydrogenase